jgi:hypothetical protein
VNTREPLCRGLADRQAEPLPAAAGSFRQDGRPLFDGYGYEEAAAMSAAIQGPPSGA